MLHAQPDTLLLLCLCSMSNSEIHVLLFVSEVDSAHPTTPVSPSVRIQVEAHIL